MARRYWLDLFTGKTWDEFLRNGASVSGFRERRKTTAEKIQPGDYLLCYLTGISRFVGVLEVKSSMYKDESRLWEDQVFPLRFKVELVYKLEPATAVPVLSIRDKLSIFQDLKDPSIWSGFFRGSPAEFTAADGNAVVDAIRVAVASPVTRPFDENKYRRTTPVYETKKGIVTVPEEEKESEACEEPKTTAHKEIQYTLLKVGSDLGLDIWAARNNRNDSFNGVTFKDIPHMRDELPIQYDVPTQKTIEHIDVLWLQSNAIVAAFEVEDTTAIYSGLLRMSDLVSMQPNSTIDLYIVAPDNREDKVVTEINRSTFKHLKRPLSKICKFIPYSELKREVGEIGQRIRHMNPAFIKDIAKSCELDED